MLALFAIFLMPSVLSHRLKVFISAEFQLLVVIFAFAALFAFIFAVAAGTLWEIFEFFMDQTFGYTMQKAMFDDPSGLTDTMWDLIVDSLGAGSVAVLGWWYMSRHQRSFMDAMIWKFIARNPNLFRR